MRTKSYIILVRLMLGVMVILMMYLTTQPVLASYAGDKPLTTVIHDTHRGGVEFTLGNSTYSGEMQYNDTYTVMFDVDIPVDASIKFARMYTYWVWSKNGLDGIYPLTNASVSHNGLTTPVSEVGRYTDTKGFVARYDFFSGADVYDLSEHIREKGTYSFTLTNSADDGRTFCLQGSGLLIAYESADSPMVEYWINEGCDMLYAEYGITPEMATTTTYFNGNLDTEAVSKAYLITISPSGGYAHGAKQARNKIYFNEKTDVTPILGEIIRMLFGSGKVWKDVYITSDTVQIAQDERVVTNYLKPVDNFVSIQDSGDYLMITNAILILEYGENGGEETKPKTKSTSGFGLLLGIVSLLIAYTAGKR